MRVKRAVVVYRKRVPLDRSLGLWKEHAEAFKTVLGALKKRKIAVTAVEREAFRGPGRADLVIAVGGDGTFLTASHWIDQTPILGVNATPHHSVAFFSAAPANRFPATLDRLLADQLKVKTISRLEAYQNGRRLRELILNEVLFCHPSPAGTARYRLSIGREIEEHRSSGVLVATAAGSAALIHSAGGRPLPLGSGKIQLVIREPYEPIGAHYRLKKRILPPPSRVRVISKMANGIIFIDGSHITYRVRFNDEIEVKRSERPLYVLR